MNAEHLNQVLSNWSKPGGLPKVLYTIPNGSNPTGASMDVQRKQDIYSVRIGTLSDDTIGFRLFRLLKSIIWLLSKTIRISIFNSKYDEPQIAKSEDSVYDVFQKPDPSFLSMDVDGRVVRLDSMSKVLSAG